MVNKGFPKFGMSQAGAYIASLKNYNLPEIVLKLVANDCNSDLLVRGRIDDRLQSMNDQALELLHKVFVNCDADKLGKYAQYRFFAYISSMYHKCEILINETIPGKSGKNHKVPVAVKSNGAYIAIAFNKPVGSSVTKSEMGKFYKIADDLKKGDHGTMLNEVVYGTSVGFRGDALLELEKLSNRNNYDTENKIIFKIANFENRIYSITKC